ncbi:TIR domain-containing protein [Aequorivita lipolytica]|uniref:CD-NTase-associated protein 12/Pycsar effector protein TIR domain-containing protein n=1 Tax=Aequorivita lipolytica TaxID=153267 RepID=A0A5C6YQA4_9FLAO|nr:nucleotide-binding protein [Aequorivita lipolytica]TXD69752.1 hypothetical protein ESV24_04750 [Aequorivita lipolytica]SRX50439.1 hypothetical protein AEQU2_00912 [Aequorivita lipolytica]
MKDFQKEIESLDHKVLILTYKSDKLKQEVQEITDKTLELFTAKIDVQEKIDKFRKILKAKSVSEFDIHKLRFSNDLHLLKMSRLMEQTDVSLSKIKSVRLHTPPSNKIFIVHGHNEVMKKKVADFIGNLGLQPIILHEQRNQGRTIIEKFEHESDVGFAVVLLSADDLGLNKNDKYENAKLRARQNVIFELGYFIGKIGRENVVGLLETNNNFEFPTDYQGVIYEKFDDANNWQN